MAHPKQSVRSLSCRLGDVGRIRAQQTRGELSHTELQQRQRAGRLCRCHAHMLDEKLPLKVYCSSLSLSSLAMGVRVPNRPSFSLLGPAVKKRVWAGPAPLPLPNSSAHSPSIFTVEPSGFRTFPMKRPVIGLKAAMVPPRKLPTSRVWLNSPKFAGASAIPHGALNQEPCWIRCSSRPLLVNTSTKPKPSPPTGSCRGGSCLA